MDLVTKRLLKIFPCVEASSITTKRIAFMEETFVSFDYKGLTYYLEFDNDLRDLLPYCPPIEDDSVSAVQQRVSDLTIRAAVYYESDLITNKTIYVPSRVKVCSISAFDRHESHEDDVFTFEAETQIKALISRRDGIYICNTPVIEFYTEPAYTRTIKQDLTQLDLQTYVSQEDSKDEVQLPPNTEIRYVESTYNSAHAVDFRYRSYVYESDIYSTMKLSKAKKVKTKQIIKAGNSALSSAIIDLLLSQGLQAAFNDSLSKLTISDEIDEKTLAVKSSKFRELYTALADKENLTLDIVMTCCRNVFGETVIPKVDEILDYLQNTLIDCDFEVYVFKTNKKGTSCTLILIEGENATLFTLKPLSTERFEAIQDVVKTARSIDALYKGFENADLLSTTTYIPDVIHTYDLKDLDMLTNKVLNFRSDYVSLEGTSYGYSGLDAKSCNKTGPRIKIKGINTSEKTSLNGGSLSRFELMQDIENLSNSLLKRLYNTMLVINGIKTWTGTFARELFKMKVM